MNPIILLNSIQVSWTQIMETFNPFKNIEGFYKFVILRFFRKISNVRLIRIMFVNFLM